MTHIIEVVSCPQSRSSFKTVICIIITGIALLAWQLRQAHASAQQDQREAAPFATDIQH